MTRTKKTLSVMTIVAPALLMVVAQSSAIGAEVAASLTGTWTVTVETPQGSRDGSWELEQQEDGTLTGSIEGMQGSADADGGWVKDDAFGFSVSREFQGQSFEIEYDGTFTEDALEGSLTAGGGQFTADFTGVRAATREAR